MISSNARIRHIGIALAAVLCGSAPAAAVTDTAFTYSPVQTGYYSINPMDMHPDGNGSMGYPYANNYNGGYLRGNGCYNTGVHLPHGARLVDVTAFYTDTVYNDFTVLFYRLNLSTGVPENVFTQRTRGSDVRTSLTVTVPSAFRTVSNVSFAYGFAVCFHPGTFSGARIRYTYTSAGD